MDSVFSDVRFETLEEMRVASCCIISRSPEVQVTLYLPIWAKERGIEGTRAFGFDYPVSDELKQLGFRGYEYWIVVPEHITETEGVVIKNIPRDEYAVLRITDPFSEPFERIPIGWKKLRDWVSVSDYKPKTHKGRFCLEEVIEDEDGNMCMDCLLPIK